MCNTYVYRMRRKTTTGKIPDFKCLNAWWFCFWAVEGMKMIEDVLRYIFLNFCKVRCLESTVFENPDQFQSQWWNRWGTCWVEFPSGFSCRWPVERWPDDIWLWVDGSTLRPMDLIFGMSIHKSYIHQNYIHKNYIIYQLLWGSLWYQRFDP